MKFLKFSFLSLLIFLFCQVSYGQEGNSNNGGRFSGNLQTNANFFVQDSAIGAFNTPQYDHQLYGADSWLNLNYSNWGFDIGVRFDLFNNSNLLDPAGSYTDQGIGRWFVRKKIQKLSIAAGYIYDQIGSGIIYRAYEERALAIDNALYGVSAAYDLTENWKIKGFTGRQKRQFDIYDSVVKGMSIDGFANGKEGSKWSIAPGFGAVARTIDDPTMDLVVSTIQTYTPQDSIGLKYNAYAFSLYNTLTYGKFTWYAEGAYKTTEAVFDPDAPLQPWVGPVTSGKFVSTPGSVLYTTLSYAAKGFGVTVEAKRTDFFKYRADPFADLNRGVINFLPPMSRVNTYRLLARYAPATLELGEQAIQIDLRYRPKRKLSFNVNFSNITDLNNSLLYREIYTEALFKYKRKWQILGGVQLLNYNQEVYIVKPEKGIIQAITPYAEFLYKFSRKKSLRIEAQYMLTNKGFLPDEVSGFRTDNRDFGDWVFLLAEFSIAPHWTFTISDMYNIDPDPTNPDIPTLSNGEKEKIHYPRLDIYYTHKANRFSLSYVKQVEGIVCAGGICRVEPAFSGVKMTVNSTF